MGENLELNMGVLFNILENQITNDDNDVWRNNIMKIIYMSYIIISMYRLLLPCKELLKFMVGSKEVSYSALSIFISSTLLLWLGKPWTFSIRSES